MRVLTSHAIHLMLTRLELADKAMRQSETYQFPENRARALEQAHERIAEIRKQILALAVADVEVEQCRQPSVLLAAAE